MAQPDDVEAQNGTTNGPEAVHETAAPPGYANDQAAAAAAADYDNREKLWEKDRSLPPPAIQPDVSAAVAAGRHEPEHAVSAASKWAYLGAYFACNVALTLYNKAVLGKFSYPWLLTAIHTGSATLGCYALQWRGLVGRTELSTRQETVLLGFSVLFTINIAVSNVSLAMVSIPFHQIMRSTCPVFTVLIYRLRYKRTYSTRTYFALVPVVLGVALATYGDYYFTAMGFMLTFLGVLLASAKTVATNRIMTGPLALSPLESLLRMSPLACVQALLCAFLSGELSRFTDGYNNAFPLTRQMTFALLGNGALAFALNIASFSTNRKAGALTMTVCGNVKQCLTVLLGITMFGVKVGLVNGLGMFIALAGAAWYSAVELSSKTGRR